MLALLNMVPERIFCIWLGSESMSEARRRQFADLRELSECEVVLVREHNLHEFVSLDRPLHPGYELLTVMHQADYLRAYLMAVHGGGYSDVKAPSASWRGAFRELNSDLGVDVIGYRIPHQSHAARSGLPARWVVAGRRVSPSLMLWRRGWWRHLGYRVRWKRLIGPSAFVMRAKSPFSSAYLAAIERELDRNLLALGRRAAFLDDGTRRLGKETYYGLDGYPFRWISLANDVLHPLCWRYRERVRLTLPPPNLRDYR